MSCPAYEKHDDNNLLTRSVFMCDQGFAGAGIVSCLLVSQYE